MITDKNHYGKVTASRAIDVMSEGRRKDELFGQTFFTYAKELAMNRLGVFDDDYTSQAMEWGIENEPFVRDTYANKFKVIIDNPEFIISEFDNRIGATPDGIIRWIEGNIQSIIEIKCPQVKAHWDNILTGIPKNYYLQVQFQLMVTGASWCDFISWNPEFPDELQFYRQRIEPDKELIEKMRERAIILANVVDLIVEHRNLNIVYEYLNEL